jgi:hypothetical protein
VKVTSITGPILHHKVGSYIRYNHRHGAYNRPSGDWAARAFASACCITARSATFTHGGLIMDEAAFWDLMESANAEAR